MALMVQDNAGIFLRVAFDVLIVHGVQLACLRNPPHNTAMDNFLGLLSTIVDTDTADKATAFSKTCIGTAFETTREACRRRKGALLPQPLHRMFIGIINEIVPCEKVPLYITLDQLAGGLRMTEPRLYPAFCFAWLEILAHRKVMVPMLSVCSPPDVCLTLRRLHVPCCSTVLQVQCTASILQSSTPVVHPAQT